MTLRGIERPVIAEYKTRAVMYYGFDIGGTKIALGVTQRGGAVGKSGSPPHTSYSALLDAVCELVASRPAI